MASLNASRSTQTSRSTLWRRRINRYGLLAVALSVAVALPLRAQAVAGGGDDAIPIPKGGYRFRIGGLWNDYTSVFTPDGASSRRGILDPLATSSLDTRALPQLSAVQQAIRTLSGSANYTLSLGTFESIGDVRQSTVPLALDVGITKRISLGLLVPYVESRNRDQLVLNRAGTSATVGQNPAIAATAGAAARSANGTVLRQLAQSRARLAAEIARCADPTATGCTAIRANPAGAQALLDRALGAQAAIATVYGDSVRAASPLVPISGSTTHTAIVTSIGSLRSDFQGFGVTGIAPGVEPAPATVIYGPGSLRTLAGDSTLGLNYDTFGGTRRAGIGDVDFTATALLFDTFDADQKQRLNNTGRALRTTLTAGFRFGTAGANRAQDPFDVPIGDGASAILLRSTTDVIANKWFWMSGTVRVVRPFSDAQAVALPLPTDSTLFHPFTIGTATRSLGQRTEIEIAPRVMFGQFFGLSGAYLLRRVGATVLTPQGTFGVVDCAPNAFCQSIGPQTTPATTLHAVSVGASFSSLASYVRGGAKFPLELQFVHTAALSASGGIVPASATDRLELRIYRGFPRR